MPRTKKDTSGTPKRSAAQIKADKAYKEKNKANQRENFANISATFPKAEKEYIAQTFAAYSLKTSEVIRAAAERLTTDGETAAAQIKADAAAYIARAEGNAQNAPTTDENTTPNA